MSVDLPKVTELRVKGMRALADVRLPLDGLTVLIGDNGSGKSTLIEAFEILRKVGGGGGQDVVRRINESHGGLASLLRFGQERLSLGVSVEAGPVRLDYDFTLRDTGRFAVVEDELLRAAFGPEQQQTREW